MSQEMKSGFEALVKHIVPLTRRIERLIELDEAKVLRHPNPLLDCVGWGRQQGLGRRVG